jgi:hypothetical protein
MASEDAVSHKTFWTVCSAITLLCVGSFGHSEYLDSKQSDEKKEWRQDFKSDIKGSIGEVKDQVKDLKREQQHQTDQIRQDTQRIQDSINRLLDDQREEKRRRQ